MTARGRLAACLGATALLLSSAPGLAQSAPSSEASASSSEAKDDSSADGEPPAPSNPKNAKPVDGASPALVESDDAVLEQASALFWEAHERYEAGDFAEALPLFERSYELLPQPEILFNIALSHHKLGHCQQARERFQAYLEAGPAADGETRARRQLELLQAECEVSPSPPTAEPEPSEEASAGPGPRPKAVHPTLLEAPSELEDRTSSDYWTARTTLGWASLGAGAVAGTVAVYFEVRRRHFGAKYREAPNDRPGDILLGDRGADYERNYNRARTVAILAGVAAGGFAATGATLLLWNEDGSSAALAVNPSGIQLSGRF